MKCRRSSAVVALAATLGLAGPAPLLAQALQRSMYVSVLDESGAPVPNLGPTDFVVREDNIAREVLRVAPADAPMQVALLFDTSSYAVRYTRDFREAAKEFIQGMTSGPMRNEIAIIGIGERPTLFADYTTDQKKLTDGLGRAFPLPQAGQYLLDAIYETAKAMKKKELSRPVVVALYADGREFSTEHHARVVEALKDAGASFHVVLLGPPSSIDVLSNEGKERAQALDEGTTTTGGRYDNVLAATGLQPRMKEVAAELTHQYLVTYARPQQLIPPEKITVSVKRSGLTARGTPVKESGKKP